MSREVRGFMVRRGGIAALAWLLSLVAGTAAAQPAAPSSGRIGVLAAARESLVGDVYADPSRWRPLAWGTLFSEGWDEAWVSPPNGDGGAPRQGWLNSADGVFYRLAVGGFTYTSGREGRGPDRWDAGTTVYLPLSRRFEVQLDIPFVASAQPFGGSGADTGYGDFRVSPRIMLSETRAVSQSLSLTFRTPTGDFDTGNGQAAFAPNYQFWANWWSGLVVRGAVGMYVPFRNVSETGGRTGFLADLAAGWYWTPHETIPFGDLVTLLSMNVFQPTDGRAPNSITNLSLTPGFRTHLGHNWYLLGAVEVPITSPSVYDYRVSADLMYVF